MSDERQSGRTTRQIEGAPANAVFICQSRQIDYTKALARYLGRPDLMIVGPYVFSAAAIFDGKRPTAVILDHAALDTLHPSQREHCDTVLARLKASGIPTS